MKKNETLTVVTLDPIQDPFAVQQGVIEQVDIQESLTPLTFDFVMDRAKPDLILLTTTTEDLGLGKAPGIEILAESLRAELMDISDTPVIQVARTRM